MLSTSYVAYGSRHENGLKIRLMSGNGPGVEPGRVEARVSLFTLVLQSGYVLPREEYWGTGMRIGTVCR